jgi:spore germination protein KC
LEWTEEGKPVFSIDIKVKANISEQSDSTDMEEDEFIKKLEQNCNKKIKDDIMASIKKCQSCNSDIFGFGAKVFDKNPNYWKDTKEKWNNEIYPNIDVKVDVDTKILRTGLVKKSLNIQ